MKAPGFLTGRYGVVLRYVAILIGLSVLNGVLLEYSTYDGDALYGQSVSSGEWLATVPMAFIVEILLLLGAVTPAWAVLRRQRAAVGAVARWAFAVANIVILAGLFYIRWEYQQTSDGFAALDVLIFVPLAVIAAPLISLVLALRAHHHTLRSK